MPIYEYECSACRHKFEKRQRFFDEAVAECPKCQSKSQRVFCPAPVIFKGSGFYVTDYRGAKNSGDTATSKGDTISKGETASKGEDTGKKKEESAAK